MGARNYVMSCQHGDSPVERTQFSKEAFTEMQAMEAGRSHFIRSDSCSWVRVTDGDRELLYMEKPR